MRSESKEVHSVGMDWITYVTTERRHTKDLMLFASSSAKGQEQSNVSSEYWKGLGYAGSKLGSFRWGERNGHEGIMIISGGSAIAGLAFAALGIGRPTRVDLQVTIRCTPPNHSVATRVYSDLENINKSRQRKRYIKLISSSTGDTVYVGKRTSKVMLRLYDKTHSVMQGQTGLYWRYEVEYKSRAAVKVLESLTTANDLMALCLSQVFAEYVKRDVQPRFSTRSVVDAIEVGMEVSTKDSKLRWLEKCVAPVVTQLCIAGYEEQVLHSLKLRDVITVIRSSSNGSK